MNLTSALAFLSTLSVCTMRQAFRYAFFTSSGRTNTDTGCHLAPSHRTVCIVLRSARMFFKFPSGPDHAVIFAASSLDTRWNSSLLLRISTSRWRWLSTRLRWFSSSCSRRCSTRFFARSAGLRPASAGSSGSCDRAALNAFGGTRLAEAPGLPDAALRPEPAFLPLCAGAAAAAAAAAHGARLQRPASPRPRAQLGAPAG
mmetsp:Transcript_3883/g.9658  ORF Transcript_3883/g.9658 Transcript_3883/m.9658 type:complete len:201 (+) Transcript_3883:1427-2029(+)